MSSVSGEERVCLSSGWGEERSLSVPWLAEERVCPSVSGDASG